MREKPLPNEFPTPQEQLKHLSRLLTVSQPVSSFLKHYITCTISIKKGNNAKSETYRQRLLQKYPDNEFSRILSDPAYYEKKMADMRMAEKTYDDAYNAYNSENFNNVIAISDDALKKFPQDQLAPKFLLIKAYSVARPSDERAFKEELTNLIKIWPETESKKAAEIIAYLNQKMPELKVEEDKKIATEIYTADTTGTHVFALIIMIRRLI